jgi:hypothetical protein
MAPSKSMMILERKTVASLNMVKQGSEPMEVIESRNQEDKECEHASAEKVEKSRVAHTMERRTLLMKLGSSLDSPGNCQYKPRVTLRNLAGFHKCEISDRQKYLDLAGVGQYPGFRAFESRDLAVTSQPGRGTLL